jgi:hypothetical protein
VSMILEAVSSAFSMSTYYPILILTPSSSVAIDPQEKLFHV